MSARLPIAGAALLLCAALAGCSDDSHGLQAWMDETRAAAPRRVARIPEPKRFEPFRYEARAGEDPFSKTRLQGTPTGVPARNKGGLSPDTNRRREPLEAFPLDTIRLVGHLYRASTGPVALLEADKVVFQARIGSYVGQHFGRITRISETEVAIKETVQDAAGDWVQRDISLALQEPKK